MRALRRILARCRSVIPAFGLALAVSACGGGPRITDTTVAWTQPLTPRTFSVDLDVPADKFTVMDLSVRFTRHFWPGPDAANTAVIMGAGNSGSFSFAPPFANTFPNSHTVFYQWVATLQGTSPGATPFTLMTPLNRFVIGCSQDTIDLQLSNIMALHGANFSTPTPHLPATQRLLGYRGEPHERSVITGNGYALSRRVVEIAADTVAPGGTGGLFDPPVLAEPSLLLYAPRQRAPGESIPDYITDMADPTTANDPYTLIGVAYTTAYDPANRPIMGCVPSDAWFVHEAGYHLRNGRMDFAPFTDGQSGTGGNPLPRLPMPAGATLWHPRLWDLHIWFDPAGGPPILSIFEPNTETTPDDPTDPPNFRAGVARGLFMPNGNPLFTFFRPTTFE